MSLDSTMDKVLQRRAEVEARLSQAADMTPAEMATLSRELTELRPVCEQIELVNRLVTEIADAQIMVDEAGDDADMAEMARNELEELLGQLPAEQDKLQLPLLPKDKDDSRNAATIAGSDVFARLKFESGVHRVQRVPETETGGRIHTSAATVAVLPEAEDVDIDIVETDLRIDVFRASGPGGQSVNTTDSAVRITHLPSGIVVSQQDEKSQHKNRAKAMKILRARIYDAERARVEAARAASRKGQVGSGDRSERIRTYNFPQGRVTDHRINLTLYKLDRVLAGEALDEVIEALIAEDQTRRLAEGVE